MSSPATAARKTLIGLLQAEFGNEGFAIRGDRLDPTLGFDGGVIGVAPDREAPNSNNRMELETVLCVQFYGPWSPETDPNEVVDPITIESWAWRFRLLIANYEQVGTSDVWYFLLDELEYGDDPTGNCTRFVASVVARGENPAY
jgi:hypothetical protein